MDLVILKKGDWQSFTIVSLKGAFVLKRTYLVTTVNKLLKKVDKPYYVQFNLLLMNKLCLLLLFCAVIHRTNGQAGGLDSTFAKNGIQTTAFFSNVNQYSEDVTEMLT